MAGRVPLKIIYLIVRLVTALAVLVFRRDLAKEAELLVLRRENAVLRRHAGRIRYEPADRARFTALARLIPRRRWAEVFPVTPATLLAWHRRLAGRKYNTSKRRRAPGGPPAIRSTAATPGSLQYVIGTMPDGAVRLRGFLHASADQGMARRWRDQR